MQKVVLLLLCVIGCALGLEFQFDGNVSGSVNGNGWQYRSVSLETWNLAAYQGGNYYSLGVTKESGQLDIDLLVGSFYSGSGIRPFSFIAYFDSVSDWSYSVGSGSAAAFDNTSAAVDYIGTSFVGLRETDTSGNVVQTLDLGSLLDVTYSLNTHASVNANLKYVSIEGSGTLLFSSDFSVDVYFIASSIAGVINQSSAAVGPKSIESVVHIQNWPYKNSANTLHLLLGVGTGKAHINGNQILSGQVYFTTNNEATVNGNTKSVSVSFATNSTADISNVYFLSQVSAKYGSDASYHIVDIAFPAGSSDIVYDPSIGSGQPLNGSGAKVQAMFGMVAFVLLVMLL